MSIDFAAKRIYTVRYYCVGWSDNDNYSEKGEKLTSVLVVWGIYKWYIMVVEVGFLFR